MSWAILRTDQGGGLLANSPGTTGPTWTRDVRKARRFETEADASRECCPENERPIRVDTLLEPVR